MSCLHCLLPAYPAGCSIFTISLLRQLARTKQLVLVHLTLSASCAAAAAAFLESRACPSPLLPAAAPGGEGGSEVRAAEDIPAFMRRVWGVLLGAVLPLWQDPDLLCAHPKMVQVGLLGWVRVWVGVRIAVLGMTGRLVAGALVAAAALTLTLKCMLPECALRPCCSAQQAGPGPHLLSL